MAKVDIENNYRLVPVHPDYHHLLGMSWRNATYVDSALPFGLRSPKYPMPWQMPCIGSCVNKIVIASTPWTIFFRLGTQRRNDAEH